MTSMHTDVGVTKGDLLDLLRTIAYSVIKACVEVIQASADSVQIELNVSFYSATQEQGKCLPSLGTMLVLMNRLSMTLLMEQLY